MQQDGWYRTLNVDYRGGPRYPHLVRISGTPDMLAKIMDSTRGLGNRPWEKTGPAPTPSPLLPPPPLGYQC